MIKEVKMYEAKCDSCLAQFEPYEGFMALNDNSALEDCIKESDWVLLDNNETYCSDCHIIAFDSEDTEQAFSKQTQNEGSKFLGNVG